MKELPEAPAPLVASPTFPAHPDPPVLPALLDPLVPLATPDRLAPLPLEALDPLETPDPTATPETLEPQELPDRLEARALEEAVTTVLPPGPPLDTRHSRSHLFRNFNVACELLRDPDKNLIISSIILIYHFHHTKSTSKL